MNLGNKETKIGNLMAARLTMPTSVFPDWDQVHNWRRDATLFRVMPVLAGDDSYRMTVVAYPEVVEEVFDGFGHKCHSSRVVRSTSISSAGINLLSATLAGMPELEYRLSPGGTTRSLILWGEKPEVLDSALHELRHVVLQ